MRVGLCLGMLAVGALMTTACKGRVIYDDTAAGGDLMGDSAPGDTTAGDDLVGDSNAGDPHRSFCGNNQCDGEEDCSSCPDDCLATGEVCCGRRVRLADRFVDFEQGDDTNPGTRDQPWQHHPWDENAEGNAAADPGQDRVYVFKRGVLYRGRLEAAHSGTVEEPICLTSAADWGQGSATLVGSVPLDGWTPCSAVDCPEIPEASRPSTWFSDIGTSYVPRLLWQVDNGQIARIPIARAPNWTPNYADDPRQDWWEIVKRAREISLEVNDSSGFAGGDELTVGSDTAVVATVSSVEEGLLHIAATSWSELVAGAEISNGSVTTTIDRATRHDIRQLTDPAHLTGPGDLVGATIWSERKSMPRPGADKIIGHDSTRGMVRVDFRGLSGWRPTQYDRYMLEDSPHLLDSPGEYYVAREGNRAGILFLWLPDDRHPNDIQIEAAYQRYVLEILNQSEIIVDGLDLRFTNGVDPFSSSVNNAGRYGSLVRIRGTCSGVRVLNCHLSHAPAGIVAYPTVAGDILDHVEVSGNELHNIDAEAVALGSGRSTPTTYLGTRLVHAKVLGNQVWNIGARTLGRVGLATHGHAIQIDGGEVVEVAHNHVKGSWGAGIIVFGAAAYFRGNLEHPLVRNLIHHNVVEDTLLGLQDYGGIASWMGGPSYVFNNVSSNAVGYRHAHHRTNTTIYYRRSCYGIGIYLDGQYKGYAFNNIVIGKNNNAEDPIYNSAAFNEAMGFMNTVFHNTFYRYSVGLHKGMVQHNRCRYLGNLLIDMGQKFIRQEPRQDVIEHSGLAYGQNIFEGEPDSFGRLGGHTLATLDSWQQHLSDNLSMATATGQLATGPQVEDAPAGEFEPRAGVAAIDSGVKVFVPWGLFGVVGEWNFLLHPADPTVILGENMNMNDEWLHRGMYQDIPRNDLVCRNVDGSSFVNGTLEDWTLG
ncbi:right-handed parallel beta-helix repeat-containing protein, partial [Myxococcota bacterium]